MVTLRKRRKIVATTTSEQAKLNLTPVPGFGKPYRILEKKYEKYRLKDEKYDTSLPKKLLKGHIDWKKQTIASVGKETYIAPLKALWKLNWIIGDDISNVALLDKVPYGCPAIDSYSIIKLLDFKLDKNKGQVLNFRDRNGDEIKGIGGWKSVSNITNMENAIKNRLAMFESSAATTNVKYAPTSLTGDINRGNPMCCPVLIDKLGGVKRDLRIEHPTKGKQTFLPADRLSFAKVRISRLSRTSLEEQYLGLMYLDMDNHSCNFGYRFNCNATTKTSHYCSGLSSKHGSAYVSTGWLVNGKAENHAIERAKPPVRLKCWRFDGLRIFDHIYTRGLWLAWLEEQGVNIYGERCSVYGSKEEIKYAIEHKTFIRGIDVDASGNRTTESMKRLKTFYDEYQSDWVFDMKLALGNSDFARRNVNTHSSRKYALLQIVLSSGEKCLASIKQSLRMQVQDTFERYLQDAECIKQTLITERIPYTNLVHQTWKSNYSVNEYTSRIGTISLKEYVEDHKRELSPLATMEKTLLGSLDPVESKKQFLLNKQKTIEYIAQLPENTESYLHYAALLYESAKQYAATKDYVETHFKPRTDVQADENVGSTQMNETGLRHDSSGVTKRTQVSRVRESTASKRLREEHMAREQALVIPDRVKFLWDNKFRSNDLQQQLKLLRQLKKHYPPFKKLALAECHVPSRFRENPDYQFWKKQLQPILSCFEVHCYSSVEEFKLRHLNKPILNTKGEQLNERKTGKPLFRISDRSILLSNWCKTSGCGCVAT